MLYYMSDGILNGIVGCMLYGILGWIIYDIANYTRDWIIEL